MFQLRPMLLHLVLLCYSQCTAEKRSVGLTGETKPTTLSDELVSENADAWHSVMHHPFTDQLADGSLSKEVLKCYLIQDHRFLDAFLVLLSSMVSHARTLNDRLPGARFLGLIAGPENTYFERSFEVLGVSQHERDTVPDAEPTRLFQQLMRDTAATGTLAEKLAVLVVAEWSYQSWGERVLPHAAKGLPFYFREWIDLHSGEYFGSVVSYLRGLLDSEAPALSKAQRAAVGDVFRFAVELERRFFDHCFEE